MLPKKKPDPVHQRPEYLVMTYVWVIQNRRETLITEEARFAHSGGCQSVTRQGRVPHRQDLPARRTDRNGSRDAETIRPSVVSNDSPTLTTVRGLQTALTQLGYLIAVDGEYGLATQNAVKSFQMSSGIVSDGVPWPQTVAELRNALAGIIRR